MLETRRGPRFRFEADSWGIPLILLACALVCRVLVAVLSGMISRDGQLYVALAERINEGHWLSALDDRFVFNPYIALIALVARTGIDYETAGKIVSIVAGSLAVVPLWIWCRSAFNARISGWAAALYVFHPVMMRTSGQVYREGLSWFWLLGATACFWSACRRPSLLRFAMAGAFATGAMLTRHDGVSIFALGALWCVAWGANDLRSIAGVWRRCRNLAARAGGLAISLAMPAAVLIGLNVLLVPAGHGWRGMRPEVQTLAVWMGTAAGETPEAMPALVVESRSGHRSQRRWADIQPVIDTLQVRRPDGLPDAEQLRVRNFLILADDHRWAIYVAKLGGQFWASWQFPILLLAAIGFWKSRSEFQLGRDLPLCAYGLMLAAAFLYHLATEQVLEARYLFCLAPCLLPWAGSGAVLVSERLRERLANVRWQRVRPALEWAVCGVLLMVSLGYCLYGVSREKLEQRFLGERLRGELERPIVIAGPEPLRRIGHYARAGFLIAPSDRDAAREWLRGQQIDYVVTSPSDHQVIAPGDLEQEPHRYRRVLTDDPRFRKLEVYRVLPIRQLGS